MDAGHCHGADAPLCCSFEDAARKHAVFVTLVYATIVA
jgi:hypothetical protein